MGLPKPRYGSAGSHLSRPGRHGSAAGRLNGSDTLRGFSTLNSVVLNSVCEGAFQDRPAQVDVAIFPDFVRVCEEFAGAGPDTLAQSDGDDYQNQARRPSQ